MAVEESISMLGRMFRDEMNSLRKDLRKVSNSVDKLQEKVNSDSINRMDRSNDTERISRDTINQNTTNNITNNVVSGKSREGSSSSSNSNNEDNNDNGPRRNAPKDRLNELRVAMNKMNEDFSSIIDSQTQQLNAMYVGMSQNETEGIREGVRASRDSMNAQLQLMTRNFKKYKKNMSTSEKQAYITVFKHRRDDLRKLEREARYRFEEIGDHAKESADLAISSWSEFGDELRELSNALNLNSMAEGLKDSTASTVEVAGSLRTTLGLTKKEALGVINEASDRVFDKYGSILSREDIANNLNELASAYRYKSDDTLKDANDLYTKFNQSIGGTVDEFEFMSESFQKFGKDYGDEMLQAMTSYMFTKDEDGNRVSSLSREDMSTMLNENNKYFLSKANGDKDEYLRLQKEAIATLGALDSTWNTSDMMSMLTEIRKSNDFSQYGVLAGDFMNIQKMMESGNITGSMEELFTSIQTYGDNLDSLDPMMKSKLKEMVGIDNWDDFMSTDINDLRTSVEKGQKALDSTELNVDEFIDNQVISPFTRLKNWLSNSGVGKSISDFIGTTGIDVTDALLTASAIKGLGGGKLFGKLGSALGLGKVASNIGNAFSNVKAGFDLFREGGKGFFSSLFKGTKMASSGKGFMGGLFTGGATSTASKTASTFAKGSKLSKLSSAYSKIAGPLAFLGFGIDGFLGSKKSEEWIGDNSLSSKSASFLGGALGGTGNGITSSDSLLTKSLDLGGGVLKGAGIGAIIGSVVPVIGTAIGGAIGGVVGGVGSAIGGKNIAKGTDWFMDKTAEVWNGIFKFGKESLSKIKEEGSKVLSGFGESGTKFWSKLPSLAIKGTSKLVTGGLFSTSMTRLTSSLFSRFMDGSHKDGLDYVPFDGYRAELHKGERVLTREENRDYSKSKGTTLGFGATDVSTAGSGAKAWFSTVSSAIKSSYSQGLKNYWGSQGTIDTSAISSSGDSSTGKRLVDSAKKLVGKPYVWGGNYAPLGTDVGTDCSGLMQWAYNDNGIPLSRTTYTQIKQGRQVNDNNLMQGDLVFSNFNGSLPEHVVMYSGSGKVIEASQPGYPIKERPYNFRSNDQIRRIIPDESTQSSSNPTMSGGLMPQNTWKGIRALGYSKQATAGIMGNMVQESGVNPTAIQGGGSGPAAGIVQWENYTSKSGRWKKMADYASSKGKQWTDLNSQLGWMDQEMQGKDPTTLYHLKNKVGGYTSFKNLTDINQATKVFEESFERSGIPRMDKRYEAANSYYKKFSAYEQGTPFVPNTQLALLHKGEMVVPADINPTTNPPEALSSAMITSSGETVNNESHVQEVVDVVKWAVTRLERKFDQVINNIPQATSQKPTKRVSKTDEVFRFV